MWMKVEEAPLNVLGHVWCQKVGDRTDMLGTVRAYDDGGRTTYGSYQGFEMTHWHPLPEPPPQEG